MNEIKFNIPLQINESLTNVKNFLNSKSPAHGPGKNILSIQKEVSKKFKFKDVFLTNSCTSALEICALAIDLKSRDEVIVPSFAFITTASSFARTGCKLKFCDIQKNNLMPSFKDIKTCVSKRTKAIVIVHYQGYSINYLKELKWSLVVNKVAEENDIKVEHPDVVASAKETIMAQFASYGMTDNMGENLDAFAENYLQGNDGQNYMNTFNKVRNDKIMDFIYDKMDISFKKVKPDEFSKIVSN